MESLTDKQVTLKSVAKSKAKAKPFALPIGKVADEYKVVPTEDLYGMVVDVSSANELDHHDIQIELAKSRVREALAHAYYCTVGKVSVNVAWACNPKAVVREMTTTAAHDKGGLILVPFSSLVGVSKECPTTSVALRTQGVAPRGYEAYVSPRIEFPKFGKPSPEQFVVPYWFVPLSKQGCPANLSHGFLKVKLPVASGVSHESYYNKASHYAETSVEIPILYNSVALKAGTSLYRCDKAAPKRPSDAASGSTAPKRARA